MRIGFLTNEIDERATWQAYQYAKYACSLLGHSTAILYPSTKYDLFLESKNLRPPKHPWLDKWMPWLRKRKRDPLVSFDQKIADRIRRDGIDVVEIQLDANLGEFDAIHHVKSGDDDGFLPRGTRYWVHAVFDASQRHGDRYVAVSQWLGRRDGSPFVPHIVQVADDPMDLRKDLGIPQDAIVVGRFGGHSTFGVRDASGKRWVWDVIEHSVRRLNNIYFLFANTEIKVQHDRIIGLPRIYDADVSLEVQKRRFINSCDVMLHARTRGETFGIAVGEFALCGKPVLTYGNSPEIAHVEMLRRPLLYKNPAGLKDWIQKIASGERLIEDGGAYRNCTPEKVMDIFDRYFIR